jgi:uncharacterized protein
MQYPTMIDIQEMKAQGLLLFECISGSRAYGTEMPGSDTDLKGVFILPEKAFYGLRDWPQLSSEKNDEVYFELRRFAELLSKSNPGVLEMLASPPDCIRHCHPLFQPFLEHRFLSKYCKNTFAGFAFAQIKKARGLNKKINQPQVQERLNPLDFCYVAIDNGSMPLASWLAEKGWQQDQCGLAAVPGMRDLFALYHDPEGTAGFSGIMKKENAN